MWLREAGLALSWALTGVFATLYFSTSTARPPAPAVTPPRCAPLPPPARVVDTRDRTPPGDFLAVCPELDARAVAGHLSSLLEARRLERVAMDDAEDDDRDRRRRQRTREGDADDVLARGAIAPEDRDLLVELLVRRDEERDAIESDRWQGWITADEKDVALEAVDEEVHASGVATFGASWAAIDEALDEVAYGWGDDFGW